MAKVEAVLGQTKSMAGERHEKANEAGTGEARPGRASHDNSKKDMTEIDQDRTGLHIVVARRLVMKTEDVSLKCSQNIVMIR